MGRRGSERRVLESQVLVRLDRDLVQMLERAVAGTCTSRAEWIRRMLRSQLGCNPADYDNHLDRVALASAATSVGRLCGALVMMAKEARTRQAIQLHADAEQTLSEARQVLAAVRQLLDGPTP